MGSIYTFLFFYYHSQSLPVGVVLVERQEVIPFLKRKPPPPLWLNRVKCSPFIYSNCFYHHSQCLRTKIKFACGCGASRQVGGIYISKNNGPLCLLLYMIKWSPYIHFYCLLSQPKLVCGCGGSRKARSITFIKIKLSLWSNWVKLSPFIHSHRFYYHSQYLRTKIKFACGCGGSRKTESISISKNIASTPSIGK